MSVWIERSSFGGVVSVPSTRVSTSYAMLCHASTHACTRLDEILIHGTCRHIPCPCHAYFSCEHETTSMKCKIPSSFPFLYSPLHSTLLSPLFSSPNIHSSSTYTLFLPSSPNHTILSLPLALQSHQIHFHPHSPAIHPILLFSPVLPCPVYQPVR